ncbi:MAG TPA: amidohydrolase family protein [Acidimicrobiales bacterium]|nr:amidohydrolase family protein [Acidimicrobiales bacterium]
MIVIDRYTVISADCHGGADLLDYKPFLESRHHEAFDEWARQFVNPFGDLVRDDADRNWDSARRLRELADDGVVAEVIYPNTIPPFYPSGGLTALAPKPDDFEQRLAGLRAHNRWLAAFCGEEPQRRAGVGQILLNDIDEAVSDVHWIADNGLRGGILLPGMPPDVPLPPLHAPIYDPVWRACEERGVVVNAHGGSASPDYGEYPASLSIWLVETTWFSHRPLWALILAGVFDRFPKMKLVLAEQASSWIGNTLLTMDQLYAGIRMGGVGELRFAEPQLLERNPSEYWHTNCYVTASFMARDECAKRGRIGSDHIMWGSDYPHMEGTAPFSKEGIARTFEGLEPDEVQLMLGGVAAGVYGFDLDHLEPIAAQCGPLVSEVAAGLETVPAGATSLAFFDPIGRGA